MKNLITTILYIVHCTLCIGLSAHEEYADSMFRAQIASEQLTDSTLEDTLKYNLFEAKLLQIKDRHEEAINLLNQNLYLNSSATYPELFATTAYLLYESYYKLQNYQEALSLITVAHNYSPNNTLYLKQLASIEYGFQMNKESIAHLKQLNKLEPYNSHNIFNLFNVYIYAKEYKNALKELEKYEKLEGHSVDILSYRVSVLEKMGKLTKTEKLVLDYIIKYPEDYYDASFVLRNIYLKLNKHQKVFNLLTDLNTRYPNDPNVLIYLADYHKQNDCDSLYQHYTFSAITTDLLPANSAIKLVRPILAGYLQDAKTKQINSTLTLLDSIYHSNIDVLSLQAEIYKVQKDTTNWKKTLYELRNIKNDEAIDFELITLAETQNNQQEIYQLTKEGYNKFQNDKWAYYYIISLAPNGKTDSLINESQKILPSITTPNIKSRIYQMIGDVYSSQQQDSLSMQMYDSCLVYDPNNSGALNNIAYNITKQPNPDLKKAEKMAAKALELDPESIYILDTYAWILFLLGDNFLSEFYFDKLLRIEKANGTEPSIETLYHIGCLYLKTNRIEQAKEIWLKAINLYNKNPDSFNEKDTINSIQQFLNDNENQ